jgi:hypothetical protein
MAHQGIPLLLLLLLPPLLPLLLLLLLQLVVVVAERSQWHSCPHQTPAQGHPRRCCSATLRCRRR